MAMIDAELKDVTGLQLLLVEGRVQLLDRVTPQAEDKRICGAYP